MQVKELKNDGLSYELEVTVTAQDIDSKIDARLLEVGKTLRLPGFRPGKVPMNILKKRYSSAVMGEVLELAVNDSTAKVLKERNLRPAMQPKIEVKEFDIGKDLKYTMNVEVLPEFKVMNLKDIKAEKPVAKPEKAKIDEALTRIASQNRETEKVETARAAKKGDIVVIDFHGRTKDDNKEHEGMHGHDHELELGSNQFIAGFEEQLTGKKPGDKVAVEVTFPKPYHSEALAGREAIFDVDLKEIREAKPAEINDAFAKRLGLESEAKLRELVETQMQTEYDQLSRLKLKRALLDALDEGHDFAVPAGMLDMEYDSILRQIKMERQAENKNDEVKLEKEEEEELRAIAERRVRLGMILAEIGRANNIQVLDNELQAAVIREAQRYPGQEAQVFEFYRKNRQALESLRAPVFEEKVIDFIIELADVKDKPATVEELTAEDEDEESYLSKKKKGKGEGKAKPEKKESAGKKEKAGDDDEKKHAKKKAAKK
jgi:trigger factor